jgi:hypothetical protein
LRRATTAAGECPQRCAHSGSVIGDGVNHRVESPARQLRVKALLIPAAPDDVLNLFPERWPGASSGKYRHSMPALNSTPR